MGCVLTAAPLYGLPGGIGHSVPPIGQAGKGEQQVGQAVEVSQEELRHGFGVVQMNHASLGSSAYRASDVQCCSDPGSGREYEGPERGECLVRIIHDLLEFADSGRGKRSLLQCLAHPLRIGGGEVPPYGEEITLNRLEQLVKEALIRHSPYQAEAGVQLVYIAVGRYAGVVLRYPAAPEQAGVSFVSGASVD